MTENAAPEKKAVVPQPRAEDLSKEIELSMEREADERIKIVRVFDDCYRCNWWVQDKAASAFWLASGTIRRSRFVCATKTKDGLLIKDVG